MITLRIFTAFLVGLLLPLAALADTGETRSIVIDSKSGVEFSENGIGSATNGVIVHYGETVLTADRATINQSTGDIFAEGSVRIQKDNQTWVGERLHYNFLTSEIDGNEFRTGRAPIFASGQDLHAVLTNQTYTATNGFISSDDYSKPLFRIHARRLTIVPNKYFEAHDATLYAGKVPLFYFPYYKRRLVDHPNNFSFIPGYRSTFGPYLLSSYNWFLNEELDGSLHFDWRAKRGFGGGPDFNYDLGRYGTGSLRYYYTHDDQPGLDPGNLPIHENRQRLYFSYDATLRTNLTVKSEVAYQNDGQIIRDFFEGEYRKDIQPNTFFEVNQLWQNWSLDALAQPRVNDFFETVERLPDVRLSGFRQQLLETPLYYESESSAGWYRRLFSDTNLTSVNFAGARADTYHQITLPETLFGWLNFTPRVGGRFTYYSAATGPGATTSEHYRSVFNTGAELSTKASRVWPGIQNHFLEVDGIRHIVEPSINYVYVPSPNILPSQLPQFDYELTNNLRLLPIEYPDYNAIDSVDSQNVIRWGLRNRIQTKRDGKIDDLVSWQLYMDWRLRPLTGQTTFSDVYSDLELKPRSWLTVGSETRYDIDQGVLNLAHHWLTLQPNTIWSWSLGHYYLRSGPLFGIGDNLITSTFYYRLNDNWGARLSHHFEARDGVLEEQYYSIYRDMRSWTAALTFRIRDNRALGHDYTVALTFTLKGFPRYSVGQDTVNASALVGY